MRTFLSISILFLLLFPTLGKAQLSEKQLVDSLASLEKGLIFSKNIKKQEESSELILKLLKRSLREPNSIDYNFDTLKIISVVTSDKQELRLFTWVIQQPAGRYLHKGLAQSYVKSNKSYRLHELNDESPKLVRPMTKNLSPKKWYGARYYKIITKKSRGRMYYTVLGWKGIDLTKNAMVIEMIKLKSNGDISFGYPAFDLNDCEYFEKQRRPRRVVFEHSADAVMKLRYDKQTILKEVKASRVKHTPRQFGFNAQRKEVRSKPKYKKINKMMIVFDQLAPLNQSMEGMYAFYIPKINVVDALLFENGKWVYYSDIDARNDNPGPERKKVIEYDLIEEEKE